MKHRHAGKYSSITPSGRTIQKRKPLHKKTTHKKKYYYKKKETDYRRYLKPKKKKEEDFEFSNVMEEL